MKKLKSWKLCQNFFKAWRCLRGIVDPSNMLQLKIWQWLNRYVYKDHNSRESTKLRRGIWPILTSKKEIWVKNGKVEFVKEGKYKVEYRVVAEKYGCRTVAGVDCSKEKCMHFQKLSLSWVLKCWMGGLKWRF